MLLFRQPSLDLSELSPDELDKIARKWKEWLASIDQEKVESGARLTNEGKVLKPGGVISDGPFVEIRERLGSFIVVTAENLDEATTLAHGCPALDRGGSVEIRPVMETGNG